MKGFAGGGHSLPTDVATASTGGISRSQTTTWRATERPEGLGLLSPLLTEAVLDRRLNPRRHVCGTPVLQVQG